MVNEQEGSIDLLVTALAKQVRSLRPQTKILYMTGYSGEFSREDMLTPDVSFIQKPFTLADLGRKIRRLLAKPQETTGDSAALKQQTGAARKAASARASG